MRRLTHHLYFWVLLGILAGGTIGYVSPATGVALKPLGDGFIALVKMLIAPIIFCTVVLGIAGAGDMKKVGRVGGKALLYFEVVSTFALVIGLIVGRSIQPGAGFNADPASLDARAVTDYAKVAASQSTVDFVLHIIPRTFFDAFTGSGDLLQVLFVAVLGASNYTYAEATWTQSLIDWIGSHVRTFTFYGGVTAQVVSDNIKSGIAASIAWACRSACSSRLRSLISRCWISAPPSHGTIVTSNQR